MGLSEYRQDYSTIKNQARKMIFSWFKIYFERFLFNNGSQDAAGQ
jgi:hypothetical protein